MPSKSSSSSADPALLELFRAEVETHTLALNEGLLALEKNPDQLKTVDGLMRAAHSIKGAARIVGIEEAVSLAHVMEDCMVAAQKGQLTLSPAAIDVLLRGVDFLTRFGSAEEGGGDADVLPALLADIAAVRSGSPPAPKAAPAPPPPPSPAASVVVRAEGKRRTVVPSGDLDAARAEDLRRRLAEVKGEKAAEIILDLSAVGDVGPAGLAVLAMLAKAATGTRLEVAGASAAVRTLLRGTGLDRAYHVAAKGG